MFISLTPDYRHDVNSHLCFCSWTFILMESAHKSVNQNKLILPTVASSLLLEILLLAVRKVTNTVTISSILRSAAELHLTKHGVNSHFSSVPNLKNIIITIKYLRKIVKISSPKQYQSFDYVKLLI